MAPEFNPAAQADTTPNASSTNIVPLAAPRPEPATASEKAMAFVKEHPVLTVAGGLALGFAISALIPRSASRKLSKRAFRLAEAGASAALAMSKDALDKAEDGGVVARKKAAVLATQAEKLGEKAVAKAERIGIAALGTAGALGHAAADRAERLGHVAADRAEHLGTRASDRLSQLGNKAMVKSTDLFGYPKPPASVADRIMDKALELKARVRA